MFPTRPAAEDIRLTVLLVGPPASGKRSLARQLLTSDTSFHCRTAEALPLPSSLDRVDYVVFMVDMTSSLSLLSFKRSLKALPPDYFLGRCCLVTTRVDKVTLWAFEKTELEGLIEQLYDIPIFSVNLSDISARALLADQLTRAIHIASGHKRGITATLVRSAELTEVTTTLFPV